MQKRYFCTIFAVANKGNRSHDHLTIHRGVEQLAARRAHNPEAGGSSPPPATTTGETEMFLLFSLRGRTDVLSHIYNPPKPSFDKEGLWQGTLAIVIVASKSRKKRLEISIYCPTTKGETRVSPFFVYIITAFNIFRCGGVYIHSKKMVSTS